MTVTGQALLTSMRQSLKISPARYTRGGKREGEGQRETCFFQNKHRNVTTNPVSLVKSDCKAIKGSAKEAGNFFEAANCEFGIPLRFPVLFRCETGAISLVRTSFVA